MIVGVFLGMFVVYWGIMDFGIFKMLYFYILVCYFFFYLELELLSFV